MSNASSLHNDKDDVDWFVYTCWWHVYQPVAQTHSKPISLVLYDEVATKTFGI